MCRRRGHTRNRMGASSVFMSAIVSLVGVVVIDAWESSTEVRFSVGKCSGSVDFSGMASARLEWVSVSLECDETSWSECARRLCFYKHIRHSSFEECQSYFHIISTIEFLTNITFDFRMRQRFSIWFRRIRSWSKFTFSYIQLIVYRL